MAYDCFNNPDQERTNQNAWSNLGVLDKVTI